MGQCTAKARKNMTKKYGEDFWKQPEDTQKIAHEILPNLQFQGTLANFKIINCQYDSISVKVEIKNIDAFILRQKIVKSNKSVNWSFQHKFQFQMTEYQLRKTFVQVTVFDKSELPIGDIKVNLFLISTGPYHQNFSVDLKKGSNTRIHFDLKIAQVIQIQLNSVEVQIDLFTKHPGQKFNYSIKTIVGHHVALSVSQPSYTVKVKLDNKQNSQLNKQLTNDYKYNHSQVAITKNAQSNAEILIPEGQNLIWKKIDNLQMPSIVMRTLVTDLHHCYFQLIFWKIFKKQENLQQFSQLFAQCYVALHKIFDTQSTMIVSQRNIQQKRQISSQDKLWHNGQQIGKGIFKFDVISDKYIKQMQVMVRTQQGIMKYSPVYFNNEGKNQSACEQIIQLIKIQQKIEHTAIQLDRAHTQTISQHPSFQSRKLKINIEQLLQKLLILLQKSSQNSIIMYRYNSPDQIMRAQQLFLSLAFKTIGYLEQEDPHINDLCWKILMALISRGQFMLVYIGFDQRDKEKISTNRIDKKLQRKIDIGLTYHELMCKYLKIAVNTLNVKGLELQTNFASLFCAYAYFRIQNFRNAILQAITKQNDPQLSEWRGIQFSLQNDIDYDVLKQQVNTFTALFDWSSNFHKCLENYDRYQLSSGQIYQVLLRQDWKYRLSKRGITFFQFIKCWVEYVESIAVKDKDIQWKYFPGYSKLLFCFLSQMKKRNILQYPDVLKEALLKLLSNERLINPIIVILFNKANMHQPLTVIRAIVMISDIFKVMTLKNKKIPPTFNYLNFYNGIKIIMESQFSFAISKTIIMLYNYFKIFSLEFRRNISMFLLGKVFFKLFLHWSYNVRHVFYHLIMRIYHETLKIDSNQNAPKGLQEQVNEQIRTRYFSLLQMLQNAKLQHKEDQKLQYFKNLEKDLHKRIKRNLQFKKRKIAIRKGSSIDIQAICPDSPASQKYLDSKGMLQDKFSFYGNEMHGQFGRAHSQILKPTIKLTFKVSTTQKQQQIKVLNTKKKPEFRHKIYDNTNGQKILMKSSLNDNYSQYNQSDFVIGKIYKSLLQYIDQGLKKFKETNMLFTKNINNKSWELPKIQMEMPLDSRQIRPQKIDSW